MSDPTDLYLPPEFPYPIKIVSLDVNPAASVERGARLLCYSFTYAPPDRPHRAEQRFGTWDSPIEGSVERWNVKRGDTVSREHARENPVILINEPCKHGIQMGGLCAICGKDMTDYDYTGYSNAARASIQMTHTADGPTVSLEEAQRIERETAEQLLNARKLSLIVDLDQTIVHATVDPTVGEWIAEGEAWEDRQAHKKPKRSTPKDDAEEEDDAEEDDSDDSSSDEDSDSEDDEVNPNWEALKDVKKFRLAPDAFGAPASRNIRRGRARGIENEGCLYYIKPRPGLQDFLRRMSAKYEMHVYTMGTRAYAEEVCTAIDPEGKIFGGRILSRDESGSLTQKSLQRLFPCDTSMVVIIDDRADVWDWSPNLIKVVPYDFFVGIGDINSAFLPKAQPLTPILPPVPPTSKAPDQGGSASDAPSPASPSPPSTPPTSVPDSPSSSTPPTSANSSSPSPSPEEQERQELSKKAMIAETSRALEAQLESRPLAKAQEDLQNAAPDHPAPGQPQANGISPQEHKPEEEAAENQKAERKALLKNDDTELERVGRLLDEVHETFYKAYDSPKREGEEPSSPTRRGTRGKPPDKPYDVKNIIPNIRAQVLDGVHILFTSVIPLDCDPKATDIWRTAEAFGATCHTELSRKVTHVVAAKPGTSKIAQARKRGGVKIVWLSWFTDSIALWRRQDETPYLLDDPSVTPEAASPSPAGDSNQVSSDPEPDTTDWDIDEEAAKELEPSTAAFDPTAIDWTLVGDEVDAMLMEDDDEDDEDDEEDGRSDKSGGTSANASEDEAMTDDAKSVGSSGRSGSPLKRKRLRSLTPSEAGVNSESDDLRSPLAKRKKLAVSRTGSSKLKEGFSAEELAELDDGRTNRDVPREVTPVVSQEGQARQEEGEEGDGEEEDDEEDDFLARELEEEWG